MHIVNKDDFTVQVSGGGRCCWVSVYSVWPSRSKWLSEQSNNLHIKFCIKLEHSSVETTQMIQKAFGDNAVSAVQVKVWHKRFKHAQECVESDPRSGRPANKENIWECWMCMGCNQQRSSTDSVRTRSWSGDSKNYCVWDFDAGSHHETCHGKICSTAFATRAEGTSCCSC